MIKQTLALIGLTLSLGANAATVTQGFLTTNDDGSTNIITDSLNNVEYLRLDVLKDLNYAQTVAVLDTQDGGGWDIANASQAIAFTDALLGGSNLCTHNGSDVTLGGCGTATGWYDGKLGNDFTSTSDIAWFIDANDETDYIRFNDSGTVLMIDFTTAGADAFSAGGSSSASAASYLLVRTSEVPIPAAGYLLLSALAGLVGVKRAARKH